MPIADLTVPPTNPPASGDAEVQRAIHDLGELLIGRDCQEQVGRLHRDLVFVEVVILQDLDMVERALDQSLGAGLAIFLEQVLFEGARVYADADRAAIGLGRIDHFAHPIGRSDIARVDAQTSRTGIGRFERAFVVEMDVRDDRYAAGADDLLQRGGAFHIGAGHADDVDARILAAADLVDRRLRVGRERVGHRLHGDRRIAANGNVADHDLAALAARNVAPRTDGHGISSFRRPIAPRGHERKREAQPCTESR